MQMHEAQSQGDSAAFLRQALVIDEACWPLMAEMQFHYSMGNELCSPLMHEQLVLLQNPAADQQPKAETANMYPAADDATR